MKIIEALESAGSISPEDARRVFNACGQLGAPASRIICELGVKTEAELAACMTELSGIKRAFQLADSAPSPDLFLLLNITYFKEAGAAPIAVTDPFERSPLKVVK